MEAKVRAAFEDLPPVTPEPPRHDAFPGPTPGLYFINKEDVNQSNVQIVGIGIDRRNPDVPAIAVMNEILGGGFGSRLFQRSAPSWGWPTQSAAASSCPTTIPDPFAWKCSPKALPPWTPPRPLERDRRPQHQALHRGRVAARQGRHPQFVPLPIRHQGQSSGRARSLSFTAIRPIILKPTAPPSRRSRSPMSLRSRKSTFIPDKLAVLVVGNGPEIKPGLDALGMGTPQPIDITIPQPRARPARRAQRNNNSLFAMHATTLHIRSRPDGPDVRRKSHDDEREKKIEGADCRNSKETYVTVRRPPAACGHAPHAWRHNRSS